MATRIRAGTQRSIFDAAGQKEAEGMELAYVGANARWQSAAAKRLRYLARTRQYFTSDDVLSSLEQRGIFTGDNRALGAIFTAHQEAQWILATGKFMMSRRRQRHRAPVRVWKSKKYEEA
jgi:hypothetical protein